MKRISARFLLTIPTDDLWEILTGRFILVFDDGELEVNDKSTIYSSYAWEYHRRFPNTPMLMKHHVVTVIGNKYLGANTHRQLLRNCAWSTYDAYLRQPFPDPNNNWIPTPMEEIDMRDILARMIYRITNHMYNDLTYRLEEWVTSMDILSFIDVVKHPKVMEANDATEPSEKSIELTYNKIRDILKTDPALEHNTLARAVRFDLVKDGQVMQCVSHRGFLTDINSHRFGEPTMRGYIHGFRRFYDSLVESRSAAKALAFTKAPLQDSEYFSRRLQLVALTLSNLHYVDCGTTKHLLWSVQGEVKENGITKRQSDLKYLDGKYYLDEDTKQLKMIRSSDKHLIGKTLKLRSVIHCAHPDPYGICSVCYGELAHSVPRGTNIGHMNTSSMSQDTSQNVMSTKHLDSNVQIEGITLGEDDKLYLKVGKDDHTYCLSDSMMKKDVALVFSVKDIPSITDIKTADNIEMLNITRVSEIASFSMRLPRKLANGGEYYEFIPLDVKQKERKASMTYELLKHIREHGWSFDDENNYVIDLAKFDKTLPILRLPMRHENMSDHAKAISAIVESNVKNRKARDTEMSPDATLIDLFNLVNEKLSVNLAVLELVLYTAMIVSAEDEDYSIPKPWTKNSLGVASTTMTGRSMGPMMAFEHHKEVLANPWSFLKTNRMDSPFDWLLTPDQIVKYRRVH